MSRAVTVSGGPSGLRQVISVGRHQLIADEPKASGGTMRGRTLMSCCCPRWDRAPT
jgi:hypothetical protein